MRLTRLSLAISSALIMLDTELIDEICLENEKSSHRMRTQEPDCSGRA